MSLADILTALRPNAQWELNGDDLSGLIWPNQTQPAPTQAEIDAYNAGSWPAPNLIAYANQKQWALATGGFTVTFSGGPTITFDTSDIGMTLITGKVARLGQANPPASFNWQTGPTTFATITAAQIIQAGCAIADFVQATFDSLNVVFADINGGSITTIAQIDGAKWPTNSISLS